jgi:hypothetical protein
MSEYVVEQDYMRGGWQVLRKQGNNGWHISSYKWKEIADEVADLLTSCQQDECEL